MRARQLAMLGLLTVIALSSLLTPPPSAAAPAADLGFNWDNAPKVYVLHWDQLSVKASDPSLPFRLAHQNNVTLMRTWAGIPEVVERWRTDRIGTSADLKRMLDDAQANGIRLIISHYLTQKTIEALAGRTYSDWGSAQRDLVTPGSPAWSGHMAWLKDLITTLGGHPAAYSWEAVNEPAWMLGYDSGIISEDQAADWLNAFQRAMHGYGAARVNMGGSIFGSMTDAQILRATQYADILDDHLYPDLAMGGSPDPQVLLQRFEAHIQRVQGLSGRSWPAMVGEYGTLPWDRFTTVTQAAIARGWPALAWEYDGWDQFWFNDTHRPEVLAYLKSMNTPSAPEGDPVGFPDRPREPARGSNQREPFGARASVFLFMVLPGWIREHPSEPRPRRHGAGDLSDPADSNGFGKHDRLSKGRGPSAGPRSAPEPYLRPDAGTGVGREFPEDPIGSGPLGGDAIDAPDETAELLRGHVLAKVRPGQA